MRRAVLFLILSFSLYAVGQHGSGTATPPSVSPGMAGQPAMGPASVGPGTTQPLGTGEMTTGSTGNVGIVTTTGGFITNGPIGPAYVPLLQTPEAAFPSGLNNPTSPVGISNLPSAMQSASEAGSAGGNSGIFNTGAADFGIITGSADDRSLGEVARDYRAQASTQQPTRVYTNADIARLNQSGGAGLGSNLGPQAQVISQPQAPESPTTPAVNPTPVQPGQNQTLPAREAPPR